MNEYSTKCNRQKKSHRGKVSGNSKHLLLEGELIMTQDLQEIKIIRLGANLVRAVERNQGSRKVRKYVIRLNQAVMNRNPEIVKEMERKMGLH